MDQKLRGFLVSIHQHRRHYAWVVTGVLGVTGIGLVEGGSRVESWGQNTLFTGVIFFMPDSRYLRQPFHFGFLPRDAHAWRGLRYRKIPFRFSVKLSVTRRYCVETAERIIITIGSQNVVVSLY